MLATFNVTLISVLQMQHATSISAEEQRIAALRSGNMADGRG